LNTNPYKVKYLTVILDEKFSIYCDNDRKEEIADFLPLSPCEFIV